MIDECDLNTIIQQQLSFNSAVNSCRKYLPLECKQVFIVKFFIVHYVLKSSMIYNHYTRKDVLYCLDHLTKAGLMVVIETGKTNYRITEKGRELIELFNRSYIVKYNKIRFKTKPTPVF